VFDIGFWELILIAVVGLVVLGPERLPVAIRSVARFIHSAKTMANGVKDELSHELKIQELQEQLKQTQQHVEEQLKPDVDASTESLKQAAREIKDAVDHSSRDAESGPPAEDETDKHKAGNKSD
jgi:sec-independent protein translocase protein TatB